MMDELCILLTIPTQTPRLELPQYASKDDLKKYVLIAIEAERYA